MNNCQLRGLTPRSLVRSPIVEIIVGTGDARTSYSAHEAVLVRAPAFATEVESFAPGGVSTLQAPTSSTGSNRL
jgi:hypothetical protein